MQNNLNKNYIFDNFKLQDTNTIVILNGSYEPSLSDLCPDVTLENKALKISQNKIPLHLLFLYSEDSQDRFDIIIEENTNVKIIEEHINLENQNHSSNITINITAKANSDTLYQKFQLADYNQSNQKIKTSIKQEENSTFKNTLINKGINLASNDSHIKLSGEEASYDNKSISLLNDNQNVTNKILIEHLKPNCKSNVLAKSTVDDKAINNFDCRVIAHPNAIKTETHVTNKNLLLSEEAKAESSPELEIYVDDVICTHGATVGQLDEDALFYLRSRGITNTNATKILINAFVKEITDEILNYDRFKITAGLNHE